jgi:hypothetical protein
VITTQERNGGNRVVLKLNWEVYTKSPRATLENAGRRFGRLITPRYCCTVWVMEAELVAIVESPLHVAVTLVEPTARVKVVNFALPALSCAVPRTVFPTAKVTGPLGLAVGEGMVAVNDRLP